MTGALIILAALIVIGLLLYVTDVKYFRHHHGSRQTETANESEIDNSQVEGNSVSQSLNVGNEICCGQHLICEKTSLAVVSDEIIYYDDEELDRFAGRAPESYSPSETEEFRDVLMTLLPQDVAGWAKSMTLRHIELPSDIRDELLLIVSDLRQGS